MLALRPLLVGPPPKPGLGARQEGPAASPERPAHGGRGLGEPQPKVAPSQQGQPRAVGVLQHAGIYFFFLRRSLLSPSLSSFSRGAARGVGKKQNRCERWSPALAERRGRAGLVQHRGAVGDGRHMAGLGPLLAGSCGDLCWVLGAGDDAAPGPTGVGVPRVPRLWGTTLETPPRGDIAHPCP